VAKYSPIGDEICHDENELRKMYFELQAAVQFAMSRVSAFPPAFV